MRLLTLNLKKEPSYQIEGVLVMDSKLILCLESCGGHLYHVNDISSRNLGGNPHLRLEMSSSRTSLGKPCFELEFPHLKFIGELSSWVGNVLISNYIRNPHLGLESPHLKHYRETLVSSWPSYHILSKSPLSWVGNVLILDSLGLKDEFISTFLKFDRNPQCGLKTFSH